MVQLRRVLISLTTDRDKKGGALKNFIQRHSSYLLKEEWITDKLIAS